LRKCGHFVGGDSLRRISKIEVITVALLLPSIFFWLASQFFISAFGISQQKELTKAFWKGMSEDEMLDRARKLDFSIQAIYTKDDAPKDYFFEIREGKKCVMEHTINKKVYIFAKYNLDYLLALYCWIDEKGFIEDMKSVIQEED